MKKRYAAVELADGTTHEDVRITYPDQVALERTARVENWGDLAKHQNRGTALLVWHALRRTGKISGETTFQAFEGDLVDWEVEERDTERADDADPMSRGQ